MRSYEPRPYIGTCYVCRLPVRRYEGVRVADVAVGLQTGRTIKRLAHAGDCAAELRHRIGGR